MVAGRRRAGDPAGQWRYPLLHAAGSGHGAGARCQSIPDAEGHALGDRCVERAIRPRTQELLQGTARSDAAGRGEAQCLYFGGATEPTGGGSGCFRRGLRPMAARPVPAVAIGRTQAPGAGPRIDNAGRAELFTGIQCTFPDVQHRASGAVRDLSHDRAAAAKPCLRERGGAARSTRFACAVGTGMGPHALWPV